MPTMVKTKLQSCLGIAEDKMTDDLTKIQNVARRMEEMLEISIKKLKVNYFILKCLFYDIKVIQEHFLFINEERLK
jgi:hypothetical protein